MVTSQLSETTSPLLLSFEGSPASGTPVETAAQSELTTELITALNAADDG